MPAPLSAYRPGALGVACTWAATPDEPIAADFTPGDRVFFEPRETHWHGAAPTRFMTRIAIQQADEEGKTVTWGDHVSDADYTAAPAIDG